MKIDELCDKVSKFATSVLAAKSKGWATKFAIGAFVPRIPEKVSSLASAAGAVSPDGDVDVCMLHDMVSSGFATAGHLDLLGGLIGFDPSDAEDLFAFVGK